MKKKLSVAIFSTLCIIILSCSGKKETAASVAEKWCELNAKVYKASDGGDAYEAAKMALKKFENDIEAKYKNNEAFMDEVEKEVEKCEAASEGR